MSIRDEDLIDYLMGEADSVLIRRVQLALQSDSQVAIRLEELRAALGMLDSMKAAIEPPADLTQRTLDFIDQHCDESVTAKVRLKSPDAAPIRSPRRAWESLVVVLSLSSCVCLFLPLVLHVRSLSRQLRCSENLHEISQSLVELASDSPQRRFPEIPKGQLDSFAGRYVLVMSDHGKLPSHEHFRCYRMPGIEPNSTQIVCFPTTQQFFNASASERAKLRKWLGGDYAYNYGMIVNDRVVGLPVDGNSSYMALLGDAPEVVDDRDLFNGHDGLGINVCFADGHVAMRAFSRSDERLNVGGRLFSIINDWQSGDHPFRNAQGLRAHGLNIHDAALGPSASEPE